ncbi:glycosyltransferase family 2 protein [Crateriforma conspicua]|uniref:glycosyltransferase family 2 protein n=1 Tax=Crateriforma conspicua TaxID=2527996 RepID=UPI0013FCFB82|nr:glycosyltransferase [Crateriforma conspicua]
MNPPKVTAIITVYNEQQWIRCAVDSLLNQSLRDIEVLVLDDGSDDDTPAILDSIDDDRLQVVRCGRLGRAAALARAVELATGRYIANLDADDVAYPDRLRDQAAFLDANPDHAWIGGGEEREDTQRDEHYVRLYPESDADVRRMSAKCIPYCHSAVTFRKSLLDQGLNYDPDQPFLIDFEFFLRVAARHKVANLPHAVVKRRAHAKSYFQRSFTYGQQNRELSRLCRIARRQFNLPVWMEAYPLARTVYPMIPAAIKTPIRRALGLDEGGES